MPATHETLSAPTSYYALILAGGGGTRLWPMSRAGTPKQLLPLVEDHSMYSVSVERLAPLFPPENIYVVAGERYIEALQAQTPGVPARNFIAEPSGCDSGPAAALGIAVIQARDPNATVAILTADHHISDKEGFRQVLAAAYQVAQSETIVTLGISPSMPSTAFGYIRKGEKLHQVNGYSVYQSLGFTEKPNAQVAVGFIRSGEYSWNSGMFVWRADLAMREFARQQPRLYRQIQEIALWTDTPDFSRVLHSTWADVERISLDYAVMEKAQHMAVIPVDIGWSDVGSWDALFDVLNLDEAGNGLKGETQHLLMDTRNTLIFSDKLTVTIGIEEVVIVDTDDALMICHRERAQDVKQVVNMLKAREGESYL